MEDLSRAAGITKSSFYHHFASKEALLRAALERSLAGPLRAAGRAGPTRASPLARLRHIVRGQVAVLQRDLPYVTLLLRCGATPRASAGRWSGAGSSTRSRRLVREAVDAGQMRAGVDPAVAARLLSGTVNSVAEWYRPDRSDGEALPDDVARAVFEGFLPRG